MKWMDCVEKLQPKRVDDDSFWKKLLLSHTVLDKLLDIPYSRNFGGRKLLWISWIWDHPWKFSPPKGCVAQMGLLHMRMLFYTIQHIHRLWVCLSRYPILQTILELFCQKKYSVTHLEYLTKRDRYFAGYTNLPTIFKLNVICVGFLSPWTEDKVNTVAPLDIFPALSLCWRPSKPPAGNCLLHWTHTVGGRSCYLLYLR